MIEYHADDYGMFQQQSMEICRCIHEGHINGVSIMPNGPELAECMKMLPAGVIKTIHLTLFEGRALAGKNVPHLIDRNGQLDCSFIKLLLIGLIPGIRRVWHRELKTELSAQIKACLPYMEPSGIRIDGHGHFHMLPLVFDVLCEIIHENNYHVSYIRIPAENLSLYRIHKSELHENSVLNPIKAILLIVLAKINRWRHPEIFTDLKTAGFMGVYLSGHMCIENLRPVLRDAVKTARQAGEDLEILFHPGYVSEEADISRITNEADRIFMTSVWRKREAEAVCDSLPEQI